MVLTPSAIALVAWLSSYTIASPPESKDEGEKPLSAPNEEPVKEVIPDKADPKPVDKAAEEKSTAASPPESKDEGEKPVTPINEEEDHEHEGLNTNEEEQDHEHEGHNTNEEEENDGETGEKEDGAPESEGSNEKIATPAVNEQKIAGSMSNATINESENRNILTLDSLGVKRHFLGRFFGYHPINQDNATSTLFCRHLNDRHYGTIECCLTFLAWFDKHESKCDGENQRNWKIVGRKAIEANEILCRYAVKWVYVDEKAYF